MRIILVLTMGSTLILAADVNQDRQRQASDRIHGRADEDKYRWESQTPYRGLRILPIKTRYSRSPKTLMRTSPPKNTSTQTQSRSHHVAASPITRRPRKEWPESYVPLMGDVPTQRESTSWNPRVWTDQGTSTASPSEES